MLSKINQYLIFFTALICLMGCSSDKHEERLANFQKWIENNHKIKVLSTTAMIDDLVKQIGGEHVDTMTLIQGELDPHSYQLVKGDDEKLNFAQIIFYNGLGLEHGPSLQHYLVNNSKAVSLGDHLKKQKPEMIIQINGQTDPHIWLDISMWNQTIPFIVESLSQQDPAHADAYQLKGQKLSAEMEKAHQKVYEMMHQVPESQRYLVTSHDAFNYFTRAYLSEPKELTDHSWQKRFAAPEGLAPESQLSVTHIKTIIDYLKQHQIHLLFPESNISRDSIKKIVQAGKEQGLDIQIACCVLYSDAMGKPNSEADSYLKMILYNGRTISEQMQLFQNKDSEVEFKK